VNSDGAGNAADAAAEGGLEAIEPDDVATVDVVVEFGVGVVAAATGASVFAAGGSNIGHQLACFALRPSDA
jgi:hypothetical protein